MAHHNSGAMGTSSSSPALPSETCRTRWNTFTETPCHPPPSPPDISEGHYCQVYRRPLRDGGESTRSYSPCLNPFSGLHQGGQCSFCAIAQPDTRLKGISTILDLFQECLELSGHHALDHLAQEWQT